MGRSISGRERAHEGRGESPTVNPLRLADTQLTPLANHERDCVLCGAIDRRQNGQLDEGTAITTSADANAARPFVRGLVAAGAQVGQSQPGRLQ